MKAKLLKILISTSFMIPLTGKAVFAESNRPEEDPVETIETGTAAGKENPAVPVELLIEGSKSNKKQMKNYVCGNAGVNWFIGSGDVLYIEAGELNRDDSWKNWCSRIREICVIPHDNFDKLILPEDSKMLFSGLSSLTDIDAAMFDTGNVNDMGGMFSGCTSLQNLDLTSFNTGRVENMANMFNDCINLKNVNLAGFDASHVKSFRSMFSNCRSLENVNLSVSDTCKPENLTYMFYQCGSLKSIDLYGFNTANIGKDQNLYMFYGCSSLDEMKLSADFFNGDMTDSHPYSDQTKWVQLSLKPNVKSWQEMTQSWDENDAGYWGLLHDSVFLHFDTNGGSEMDSLQMNPGSSFAAGSYIPLKPGYAFTGWFLDPECTEQIDDCCILNFDLTLYAGWKVKHYTIMFDTNCGLIDSYTGVYGSSHDISGFKLAFFNGKFFTGWYTDPECTHKAEDQFILTEDITFYAGWE